MENSGTVRNARIGKSYPVESKPAARVEFDIEGIICYHQDLNILRQAHCHLIGSGKKASEYEKILHYQLNQYVTAGFDYIEHFREYLLLLLRGNTPSNAIGYILSMYRNTIDCEHKQQPGNPKTVAKSGINTPPQKKIERGGFGKSAKSKKVIESDSPFPRFEDIEITLQKAKDELSQSEKEFELEYSKLQIRFYLITILIPAILLISVIIYGISTRATSVVFIIATGFIKRGTVTQFYFQNKDMRTYLYFTNGKVLTERQFNDLMDKYTSKHELRRIN